MYGHGTSAMYTHVMYLYSCVLLKIATGKCGREKVLYFVHDIQLISLHGYGFKLVLI